MSAPARDPRRCPNYAAIVAALEIARELHEQIPIKTIPALWRLRDTLLDAAQAHENRIDAYDQAARAAGDVAHAAQLAPVDSAYTQYLRDFPRHDPRD